MESNQQETSQTSYSLYNSFLINFINKEFLSNLINVSLYQAELERDIIKFIKKFLFSLRKDIKNTNDLNIPVNHFIGLINTSEKILSLKEDFNSVINYDNILNHFSKLDSSVLITVKNIQNERIVDNTIFKKKLDEVIQVIQIYNKINEVATPVLLQLGSLINEALQGGSTPTVWVKNFTDIISSSHSNLSSLKELSKEETVSDFMSLGDSSSTTPIISELMTFLSTSFKRYSTGYPIIDENAGGIESGSVTIISGPSNHAKSIFMINIMKNIVEQNRWDENDAVLLVSLEDDKFKVLSRALSIFGNYNNKVIKEGYIRTGELNHKNPNLYSSISQFWKNKLDESIISITKNKCKLLIKHCTANSFSMNDVNSFIERRKTEGINVKLVAVDYLDLMQSSFSRYSSTTDDYQLHGDIVLNMRDTAKNKGIPIITISQNNRGSEENRVQSNNSIGGSIKKIRYSDLVVMINQDSTKDLLNPQVMNDINGQSIININNVNAREAIPFEVTITKNKNGDRDVRKYHIFSKKNLRIYEDALTFVNESNHCDRKSNKMNEDLKNLEFTNINDQELGFDLI
jgi:replicative DNA helicase